MKQQFQSTEALRVRLSPFIDKITGDYIIGSDSVTATFKKPDGSSFSDGLTWDSVVHLWWYDVPVGSYMQGEWRIEAVSSNPNAFRQWKTPMWGDYVENLDASVSSRLAAASYVAPDNAGIAAVKLQTDLLPPNPASQTNLDVAVSSRMAAVDYVAPANADISAIKAKTDLLPSDPASETTVSTRLAAASYVAPDNAGVAAIKAKTDNLPLDPASETMVSTRLAASSYVAPDNAGISGIKAKTDNLPSDPASETTVVSRLASADYVAPDNSSISGIKAKTDNLPVNPASQTNLDVAVSTRLALVDYVAPDNVSIVAIKAKTDALPVDPASEASVQDAVTAAGTAASESYAAKIAAQAAEALTVVIRKCQTNRTKVDVATSTFTVYDDDGVTPIYVFDVKDETGAANPLRIFERVPR